jgi:hypothetical protein
MAHGFAADLHLGYATLAYDHSTQRTDWTAMGVTDRVLVRAIASAIGQNGEVWSGTRRTRGSADYIENPHIEVTTTRLADMESLKVTAHGDVGAWQPQHSVKRTWRFSFTSAADLDLTTDEHHARYLHPDIPKIAAFLASLL